MRRAIASVTIVVAALAQDTFGPPREVDITVSEGTAITAAASPDQLVIAIDLLGSIWVLPFRGGEARRVTPDAIEARRPAWAPDSHTLAFQGFGDDGAWHIYAIGIDGERMRPLTSGPFDDREPAWSHDGTRILLSSDRGGSTRTIWEVMPASGAMRQITRRPGESPSWKPGDDGLAYASYDLANKADDGIWTVDVDGHERLAVPAAIAGYVRSPAWSSDGRALAYLGGERGLHVSVNGRSVTGREDVFPSTPQWLSRVELLYTADGHIKRRSLNNLVNEIPFRAKISLTRPTYSAMHRVLEPSEPQRLVGIVNPVVSPDATRIAFTALGDLWVLPIGRAPIRITNDAFVDLDPAWSPDGTRLAFATDRKGNMDLWVHDFRANIAVPVRLESGRVSGIAWSPDGTQIGYLVDRTGVMAATAPGASPSCRGQGAVTSPYGDLGRITWGPDNCTVAMSARFPAVTRSGHGINQALLYAFDRSRFTTAVLFPEHSVGDRRNNGPAWSPDGFHMAFVSEGALWAVAVDAGGNPTEPPRVVAEDFPDAPSWEGASRRLVYLTPAGLRRVGSEGGFSQPIACDLGWAPSRPPRRVVVHAGQLFDGRNETVRGETDVVIEHGIIADVTPHNNELHTGAVLDAGDETVMPGLIDARTYLDPTYGEPLGRIWLAYGVTSVRDVSLNPYAGLEQREAIANGRRIGPRVFMAGDPFDGVRAVDAGGVSIGSDAQLEAALTRAILLGVDFLTTRGRLGGRLESRLADYAHAQGLRATTTELFTATRFGFDELDLPLYRPYRDIIDVIGKSEMRWAPMLCQNGGFESSYERDRSIMRDPRLLLFPPQLAARYAAMGVPTRITPGSEEALKPRRTALKAIVAAGGRIVTGTEAPKRDVPYGLSLHIELEQLVLAGLSPFQALQAATLSAAEALGVADELGSIEPGKLADLVFLGNDPLQDIRRTRDVRRVMRGGRVYDAATLRPLGSAQQPPR